MALLLSSCWFFLTNCIFLLFKFIVQHVLRIKVNESSQILMKDFSVQVEHEAEVKEVEETEFNGFSDINVEEEEEEEPSNFSFKFEYQIPKIITGINEEPSVPTTEYNYQDKTTNISNNYRFFSEKNFNGFVHELESMTFRIHESFIDHSKEKSESKFLLVEDFVKSNIQQFKDVVILKNQNLVERKQIEYETTKPLISEKQIIGSFSGFDSDSESISLSDGYSVKNLVIDSESDGILSEEDFGDGENLIDLSTLEKELVQDMKKLEEEQSSSSSDEFLFEKLHDLNEGNIKDIQLLSSSGLQIEFLKSSNDEVLGDTDLVIDSESDDILSEKDFGNGENLIDMSTLEKELLQDMKKLEEGQSSSSSDEFLSEKLHQIQDSQLLSSSGVQIELLKSSDFEDLGETDLVIKSESDGILLEKDFGVGENLIDLSTLEKELSRDMKKLEQDQSSSSSDGFLTERLHDLSGGEIRDSPLLNSSGVQIEFLKCSDDEVLGDTELINETLNLNPENTDETKQGYEDPRRYTGGTEEKREEDMKISEETQMNDLDEEELDELESLWEHQDLIEQLKMEIKRAKAVGLPTIFEESESEKAVEDLKPWKIDDKKFFREDPMDELHKFYKSYGERMRKFDILNYQKMYAIGFLQLKNTLESMGSQKPLMPTIFSHLSQYLRPFYRQKSSTDPSEKFIKELQIDLETVYVGQMCLSWEFLRWQYEKARELPDSDPYRSHQYNQVAGEFQQFQVIMQRFIENESFQGPRLPNYVKNRCILRNLLQVPVIKEDCLKDKLEVKRKGNYAITSEKLEDIMLECIRLFWEFVKAEKNETSTILKGLIGHQVELQDPSDFSLMAKIQNSLQKKEKKLKDIMKTGNCLVKKFKKTREDRSNQDLFFSQVDMKLVSRVLKMSRITTEQLVWCHKKLSKITFTDWKIHRKPSFLLFPC